MAFPSKSELILKELDYLQAVIARFDNTATNIKSWSITVWAAIVAYSYQNEKPEILIAAIFSIFCFAFIECIYRVYQRRFIKRMGIIEDALNNPDKEYYFGFNEAATKPLIGKSTELSHEEIVHPTFYEYKKVALTLHVAGLYYFQIGSSLILMPALWYLNGY